VVRESIGAGVNDVTVSIINKKLSMSVAEVFPLRVGKVTVTTILYVLRSLFNWSFYLQVLK
jgi:hypothetical protein